MVKLVLWLERQQFEKVRDRVVNFQELEDPLEDDGE